MRTSLKIIAAACTGTLLLACGTPTVAPSVSASAPADDGLTALEQACLDEPLNAQRWEQLGTALQTQGREQRAAAMLKQARMLREHDVRRDLAILPPETVTGLDRTELVPIGPALVLVRRIPAAHAVQVEADPSPEPLRLEISNGNGVTGLAANWARKLKGKNIRVVRLSNIRPFAVSASRIEYRPPLQAAARDLSSRVKVAALAPCAHCTPADVRIVLGRDVRGSGAP
jgi:hypothetical protein